MQYNTMTTDCPLCGRPDATDYVNFTTASQTISCEDCGIVYQDCGCEVLVDRRPKDVPKDESPHLEGEL